MSGRVARNGKEEKENCIMGFWGINGIQGEGHRHCRRSKMCFADGQGPTLGNDWA